LGAVGFTSCPGKTDRKAHSGAWARDLGTDVWAIHDWGAAAVVTLMETIELGWAQVPDLGDRVRDQDMEWFHLPIRDFSVPDAAAEDKWANMGEMIREFVRSGDNVMFHCRGGLGRSGMMAARILVELGWTPERAIRCVRQERPGAIETEEQLEVVLRTEAIAPKNLRGP